MHIVEKHRRVHLEPLRYDQNQLDVGLSKIECYHLDKTCETESEAFPLVLPSNYSNKGGQSSESSFIREVNYPEWLANVVVVPKKGR